MIREQPASRRRDDFHLRQFKSASWTPSRLRDGRVDYVPVPVILGGLRAKIRVFVRRTIRKTRQLEKKKKKKAKEEKKKKKKVCLKMLKLEGRVRRSHGGARGSNARLLESEQRVSWLWQQAKGVLVLGLGQRGLDVGLRAISNCWRSTRRVFEVTSANVPGLTSSGRFPGTLRQGWAAVGKRCTII